ncbi:dienelactone hydrolase family protein [Streptomyces sp. CBMA156]|uniref:dienelactone hydrolase family protein n=2 Tax=Streptomyces sp. CBMA156 TaxID=1930280 RepID=UPI001661C5B1|nr:alpha/beta hydrolase [Streptomyces sp. CBMA156]MBD0669722.1 alpha/beta hydrolase [Streptomyces sp. CBMA156]
MQFTSRTSTDGVTERLFTLPGVSGTDGGGVPGVLWTPEGATGPRPLILVGHGGGRHKKAPGVVARAHRFAREGGYAVAALDAPGHGDRPRSPQLDAAVGELRNRMQSGGDVSAAVAALHELLAGQSVPEWRTALDALHRLPDVGERPAGYWGVSLGCGLGVPFVAAEPRVRAAVLGLNGAETSAEAAARITVPVEFLVQWDDERVPREAALALFDTLGSPDKTLHANPGGHGDVPAFELDSALRFFARHLGG